MENFELGLIGLGTMGKNLLLNMAEHGYSVAGYDKDAAKVDALNQDTEGFEVHGIHEIGSFVASIRRPRAILLLVPAGKVVDYVVADLKPHLQPGDLIIDGGNSHYADTSRRQASLTAEGIHFLGLGVSGGAEGARRGPSMMPGGTPEAYARVAEILEAAAAKVNGEPCVTYLGPGSVGHYVKMVHNGIEYGMMQLLAESYDFMKRGLRLDNHQIQQLFEKWNHGPLNSFLVEITADIFKKFDDQADSGMLIDAILDKSKQKGTGKWTSQSAMDLGVPVPVIDVAVSMRSLSGRKDERVAAEQLYESEKSLVGIDHAEVAHALEEALMFSFILTYAQGLVQLAEASEEFQYQLDISKVAKIWRGGCIIRAKLLEDIYQAYTKHQNLTNLLVDEAISAQLNKYQSSARTILQRAIGAGIPMPAYAAALNYFDAYTSGWLPANLIQAQRDYFGAHTFERNDRDGFFHAEWY